MESGISIHEAFITMYRDPTRHRECPNVGLIIDFFPKNKTKQKRTGTGDSSASCTLSSLVSAPDGLALPDMVVLSGNGREENNISAQRADYHYIEQLESCIKSSIPMLLKI